MAKRLSKEEKAKLKEEWNKELFGSNDSYIGNMWGWKFSFIGLGVMVFLFAFAAYLHFSGKQDFFAPIDNPAQNQHPYFNKKQKDYSKKDTLKITE